MKFVTVVSTVRGKYKIFPMLYYSRVSSVGIATDYVLENRMIEFRIPAGAGNFSLRHRVKNVTEAHPASYSMGIGDLSLG
jgi:hypothetical protein